MLIPNTELHVKTRRQQKTKKGQDVASLNHGTKSVVAILCDDDDGDYFVPATTTVSSQDTTKSEYFCDCQGELFCEVWSVSEGYSTVQKNGGQGRNHDGVGSSCMCEGRRG